MFIAGCVTSINMTQTTDNVYHTQVKTKTQQLHALSNLVSTLRKNALNIKYAFCADHQVICSNYNCIAKDSDFEYILIERNWKKCVCSAFN